MAAARALPRSLSLTAPCSNLITTTHPPRTAQIEFILLPTENLPNIINYPHLQMVANSVQRASRWVDTPASELNSSTFLEEIRQMHETKLNRLGVKMEVIKGHELRDRGFGGLWGVGKVGRGHCLRIAWIAFALLCLRIAWIAFPLLISLS